jgi:Domain of unknown function (DUF4350)
VSAAPAGAGTTGRRASGWLLPIGVVLVGLLALAAIGRDDGGDGPLDPRSDGRLGTSALVAVLGELGAEVTVTDRLPDADTDVFVLLADLLDPAQADALSAWVDDGGTLVVTDPGSSFVPPTTGAFGEDGDGGEGAALRAAVGRSLACDLPPLDGIDVAGVRPRNGGVLYEVEGDARSCIGSAFEAYVVATQQGAGDVVAVGGSGMVLNDTLDEGENAPVVAALMAPRPGVRVGVLEPIPPAGGGERTLVDLIAPNVRAFLAQLLVAFAVFVLWRSRRLGAPVPEPQPVAVAGSELVAAVGSLLDRAGSPQHAGDLLRADLRRFLGDRLGIPPEATPAAVVAVAHERIGTDEARLAWALGPGPVEDDDQLVALAHTIDSIREEVLHR